MRTKERELGKKYPKIDSSRLREMAEKEAEKEFEKIELSLRHVIERLNIPMPRYAKVSGIFARLCTNWH